MKPKHLLITSCIAFVASATWVSRGTIYGQNGGVATTGSTAADNESSAYLNLGTYINNAKGTATGLFTLQGG